MDAGSLGPISTVIITQNEASRLERCVRSCLPFSDEVLVIDGGSTDGTRELAERLGCRVVENPWPGYAAQRNLGAELAAHDWIFSIDSDEAADEDLCRSIEQLRRKPFDGAQAYSVKRVNSFLGQWFTDSPELKVRLYDRRRLAYTRVLVHEVVDIPPSQTSTLDGFIWHLNREDLDDAARRLNLYTSLEADQAAQTRGFSPWRLLLRPVARFGHRYVLEQSFRGGWRGLFVSLLWAYWELLREMKVYERTRRR